MKEMISRRSFLQGTGIVALTAALTACGGTSSGGSYNGGNGSAGGSNISTGGNTSGGSGTGKTSTTYTASSLKSAQIRAINTARGANGKNTLVTNSQLNQIAAGIAAKEVTGGTTLVNYLSNVFDTYDQKLEIDGKTVELHVSLEKYELGLKNYTCSTSSQMATWDASYIGNAVVQTDDAFYCAAVFATPIVKVIWTGSTNDDGTITLTGYDKSGPAPTGDITLPTTLSGRQITRVGNWYDCYYPLKGCKTITSVTVPGSIQWVDQWSFKDCVNLKSATIQEGVKELGGGVFRGCTSLQNISIPSSLESLGSGEFADCTSLKQFNYPSNSKITQISQSMFSGCKSLRKIYIPKNITTIRSEAFSGCANLTDIYYAGSQAEWAKVSIESGNSYLLNATVHYYSSAL